MSKVAGFIIGAALIVAGIATGNPLLIAQGGAMVVTQAVVLLTAPKTPARQASEMSIQLGEQPRVMLVGETYTAGSLVDGFNYGGKYGTDWEVLIIRLADHKCHSLTGFFVNDEYTLYSGDGDYRKFDPTDDDVKFRLFFRADTSTDPLPDIVLDHGPGWTSDDIGESGCDVIVAYKADGPKEKKLAWPGGRPRFGFVVKGKLQYDMRLDDTVTGGAGPHRIDDPDTWEWSENAAICRYNWVRGVFANDNVGVLSDLLVGRGLTADEAPPENIIAAANLCDELPGNGIRYQIKDANNYGVGLGAFSRDFSRFVTLNSGGGGLYDIWDVYSRTLLGTGTFPCGVGDFIFGPDGDLWVKAGATTIQSVSPDCKTAGAAITPTYAVSSIYPAGDYGGLTALTADTHAQLFDGSSILATDVGFGPRTYLTGPDGLPWVLGVSGSNIRLRQIGGADTDLTIADPSGSGTPYGLRNSEGNIALFRGTSMLVVDTSGTILHSGTASNPGRAPIVNHEDGTDTIWLQNNQYSLLDCSFLGSVTFSDWYAGAGADLFDPINNALFGHKPAAINQVNWLFLPHSRYLVAGPIYSNQEFLEVEEMFAAATAGTIITHEGSVELEPGHAKSVVATFSDEDLLSGSQVSWNQGFLPESSPEWVNTVVARYVEPDQKWNDHAAPVVRSTDEILEDGKSREASITLRLVRYQHQALRIAEITHRLGRLWGRASVKLGPRFCELEAGDWISWQSDRYFGGGSKTFRIEAFEIDEKWQVSLTLNEMNSSVFADDAVFDPDLSEASPRLPPPDIGAPEADNWELTAITLDSEGASVPALHIEGDTSDDGYVEAIIFEYWQDDGVTDPNDDPDAIPWIAEGSHSPITTQVDITSVTGGATYYAAVSYVVDGETGERLVLGPVTLSDYQPSAFYQLEDSFTPIHAEDGSTLIHLG